MRNPAPDQSGRTKTTPCCSKVGIKRGPWTTEEDEILADYIKKEGEGQWRTLPKRAGLLRCGKSCRLRWMNYLRPHLKRGLISPDEEDLILRLHRLLGNRWSLIAGRIPGRTDNEIKNYWNTHLSKKLISQGLDPRNHKPLVVYPNPNNNPPSPINKPITTTPVDQDNSSLLLMMNVVTTTHRPNPNPISPTNHIPFPDPVMVSQLQEASTTTTSYVSNYNNDDDIMFSSFFDLDPLIMNDVDDNQMLSPMMQQQAMMGYGFDHCNAVWGSEFVASGFSNHGNRSLDPAQLDKQ